MSVESFDPSGGGVEHERRWSSGELLAAAGRLEEPMFGLDRLTVARLAPWQNREVRIGLQRLRRLPTMPSSRR